jgi:hypothetical protein
VNRERLGEIIAAELEFQKRNGVIVDRNGFLSGVEPGRRVVEIEAVHLYGNQAVVEC